MSTTQRQRDDEQRRHRPPAEQDEERRRREVPPRIDHEDPVEEASDESFPASDPPAFNPGQI